MLSVDAASLMERAKNRTRRENSAFLTDAEWLGLLDVSWKRCYSRIAQKVPFYFCKKGVIPIVSGTSTYTLPTDFRQMQSVTVVEPSWGTSRPLHPILETDVMWLQPPQMNSTVNIRYTPEPIKIDDEAVVIPVFMSSDEWIVCATASRAITKEGSERGPYDQDWAMLDMEIMSYLDGMDQGWPQTVNETFRFMEPGPWPRTQSLEGYILSGAANGVPEIEFFSLKIPAVYL